MRYTILAFAVALSASALQAQAPGPRMQSRSDPTPIAITTWVTPDDWPSTLQQVTIVRFRLKVDAAGVPTSCEIMGTGGIPAVDSHTCRLLQQRARFKPGVNVAGKPIAGTFSSAIRWDIPPLPPPPPPKYDQDDWRYRMNR